MNKILSLILLLVTLFCLIGCQFQPQEQNGIKKEDFYGVYNSVFVDADNEKNSISFELEIKSGGSFTLSRMDKNRVYEGEWYSYDDAGTVKLLCTVTSGYKWGGAGEDVWNPYFTLTMTEDGTVMANAPLTVGTESKLVGQQLNNYNYLDTAFGEGELTLIQLVLFSKKNA